MKEVFYNTKLHVFDEIFSLDLKVMELKQEKDEDLSKLIKKQSMKKRFSENVFNDLKLIIFGKKIYILVECRDNLIDWYYKNLQYYGQNRTLKMSVSNFKQPSVAKDAERHAKNYDIC